MSQNEIQKLVEKDLAHVWHPCSQMKDYEAFPPIPVAAARGPMIHTADGRSIIDAISSWWCKSLGHAHPEIRAAVDAQMDLFEHVIGANTCCDTLAELSAKLAALVPGLSKVFYADNGSTGVEVAMKMSLQYHAQTGNPAKNTFVSLENGYHGETILTLAAGDCEMYSKPFAHLFPDIPKLRGLPYLDGRRSPLWTDMGDDRWDAVRRTLDGVAEHLAAIVFEPVVQGAAGMRIYSPDLLRRLRRWASDNNVHLIADEIMTGFGRTGAMFACEHAGVTPDMAVLSKGLTAGWFPMSAVMTCKKIYDAFYDDYMTGRAFLHSNTYAGNPTAAAAALAALRIYDRDDIPGRVARLGPSLLATMSRVADETGALANVRGLGFIAAADIVDPATGSPFPREQRRGFQFYQRAVENGALLRPMGDTIYFFPPLNSEPALFDSLAEIAVKSLKSIL